MFHTAEALYHPKKRGEDVMKKGSAKLVVLSVVLTSLIFALGAGAVAAPVVAAPTVPRGGTLTICAWEELTNLNPYICCILGYDPIWGGILQRLISFDPSGTSVPVLAREVPTIQNGGLSKDGRTVTYHLRANVKWADGTPFTSADVKFFDAA